MASRVRSVGLACLAALFLASASPADETTGAGPGRGGVGGQLGGSYFYAAEEYSKGALPRAEVAGIFRYVFSSSFRVQVSTGFTWSAYSKEEPPPFTDPAFPNDLTKEEYLTLVVPSSVQLQYTWHRGNWHYHVGAGPGIYRVWVENHRKVLIDPTTFRLHRGPYPGASAELGAERFFKALPSTSVEFTAVSHRALAVRDDQFPNGWNSTLGTAGLRVGANYYFSLDRGKKAELPLPATAK